MLVIDKPATTAAHDNVPAANPEVKPERPVRALLDAVIDAIEASRAHRGD